MMPPPLPMKAYRPEYTPNRKDDVMFVIIETKAGFVIQNSKTNVVCLTVRSKMEAERYIKILNKK
jgi:hypothetical protein